MDSDLRHAERFPSQVAFTAVPTFFLPFAQATSLYCEEYVYICTCEYMHISDHVQTVHELPLQPNNAASETLCNKLETARRVD